MSNYHSFLICFHEQHTDVYHNGLPLGVIPPPRGAPRTRRKRHTKI